MRTLHLLICTVAVGWALFFAATHMDSGGIVAKGQRVDFGGRIANGLAALVLAGIPAALAVSMAWPGRRTVGRD